MSAAINIETTTLGAGCFWCIEAIFQNLDGALRVRSGYSGGHIKNPSYREVCEGRTGHAEVIQIEFDPEVISFADILEVFFATHDPTTLNRQGADVGSEYRSAIFYHSEEQKRIAEISMATGDESGTWLRPIVTEISPFEVFYEATGDHQNYFAENGTQPYCRAVIAPKLEKFKISFRERLKNNI